MTDLEWIELQINTVNAELIFNEIAAEKFKKSQPDITEKRLAWAKQNKQVLHHLQQIKAKLEAWEEIQGTITEGQDSEGKYCFIETIYFTGESGQKIIKALKDDDRR